MYQINLNNIYYVEVAPYWNVNLYIIYMCFLFIMVEVAPYWNVNSINNTAISLSSLVEVAPYWNVNNILLDFR